LKGAAAADAAAPAGLLLVLVLLVLWRDVYNLSERRVRH
jgi:MYXO-CTERM domain-containing protein